ncbi:tumor necrosis factor receptor-like protein [Lymphocystis disease virus 4]|uniref:Tumor necrosis factor receptor-like protein n=1 Tax=Lymphocystis disease virus 4 TaxID=2704413 RepID=A0A6B9XML1_9VIRU|nr:tumor necrosis factor receptor-like protein [Lymphocystis disease virus 4]QHR78491.1 tumor necrosis factor receptor-like protein [Lymphocystis disease virus 4]
MLLFILLLLPFMVYTTTDCPPGYRINKTYTNKTVECVPCTKGSYTEIRNKLTKCLRCDACQYPKEIEVNCTTSSNSKCKCKQGFYYNDRYSDCVPCSKCKHSEKIVVSCTPTHNTVCNCKDGYYDKNGVCIKCSDCYLGEGVKTPCSNTTNTICQLCEQGTFSNKISISDTCNPYTMCVLGLQGLNFNVTWFDNICVNCSTKIDLTDLETFFTVNFITQRRLSEEDLKNTFRLTYNKTRSDVDFVNRDDLEGSFTYTDELPYVLKELDYSLASDCLANAYNKLTHICDSNK